MAIFVITHDLRGQGKKFDYAPFVQELRTQKCFQIQAGTWLGSFANNATQAYELAKKSYDIDKNVQALVLMGVSACKMGDMNKAKAAYKKLEPARQKQLQSVCSERGITLE